MKTAIAISPPPLLKCNVEIRKTQFLRRSKTSKETVSRLLWKGAVATTLSFILLISSCANQSAPTGGLRDTKPPTLIASQPPNKMLLFNSKTISLRFSEFIQPNLNPQEIFISPPMDKPPEIYVTGKMLKVKFKASLKENTTYTINFGDAVKDNNEGNIFKNLTYVFSTGLNLDSAKLTGKVINAATQMEAENVIVALYPDDSVTQNIKTARPYYFAKTEKDGSFLIENMHTGSYRLYGLVDQNLNYRYDQPNEMVGFSDTVIALTDTTTIAVSMSIFESQGVNPKLTDASTISTGKIRLAFSAPIRSFKLNANMISPSDFAYLNRTRDTVTYWYANRWEKLAKITTTVNDSLNDSTSLNLKWIDKDSLQKNKKFLLSIVNHNDKDLMDSSKLGELPLVSPFNPLVLSLNLPVIEIRKAKGLQILEDSIKISNTPVLMLDEETHTKLSVFFTQRENTNYTVSIQDSSLQDYTGSFNPALKYRYSTESKLNYGNIILNIKFTHPERYYIFRILNGNGQVAETLYYKGNKEKKLILRNIHAQTYRLQAIVDTNRNGEWDTGDFAQHRQPEKIINFKESYELKGGWDLEVEIGL